MPAPGGGNRWPPIRGGDPGIAFIWDLSQNTTHGAGDGAGGRSHMGRQGSQ